MNTFCSTAFILPAWPAGITTPRACAQARNTVIAISRPISSRQTQSGMLPHTGMS